MRLALFASFASLLLVAALGAACSSGTTPAPVNAAGASAAGAPASAAGSAPVAGGGAFGAGGAFAGSGGGDASAGSTANAGAAGSAAGATSAGGNGGNALSAFRYYAELKLDTTPAGANVTADVTKYPLAIVLRADSFDFTQAKPDASDVRVTTTDGAPLPMEVESWDAGAKLGVLWVKVDVKGNTTQTLLLSWGNAAATAVSDSHAVFDVNDGFLGVWHLAESGSTAPGGYKDATATGADLTGLLVTADSVTAAGRIGKAVSLDHSKNQWLRLDGAKNAAFDVFTHVTYSIWTYASSYPGQYTTPFAKGDNSWRVHMYGSSDWGENANKHIVEMCAESTGNYDECAINEPPSKGSDVAPGQWFHWVAVFDAPKLTLYLNGVKEVSIDGGTFKSDSTYPVGIGNNSQIPSRSWSGYLDEARVMGVSKDQTFAQLEYESQREGQKLLTIGVKQQRF